MTESPDQEIVFRNENQVLGQGDGDSGTETEEQTVESNTPICTRSRSPFK